MSNYMGKRIQNTVFCFLGFLMKQLTKLYMTDDHNLHTHTVQPHLLRGFGIMGDFMLLFTVFIIQTF